jgi:hypothetical protein
MMGAMMNETLVRITTIVTTITIITTVATAI